jgi:hypothetical protein
MDEELVEFGVMVEKKYGDGENTGSSRCYISPDTLAACATSFVGSTRIPLRDLLSSSVS